MSYSTDAISKLEADAAANEDTHVGFTKSQLLTRPWMDIDKLEEKSEMFYFFVALAVIQALFALWTGFKQRRGGATLLVLACSAFILFIGFTMPGAPH